MNRPDWHRIRQFYRHHELAIHRAGATKWGIDPYAWDSEAGITLTPIESALWQDIRALGLVMYPQYPVGGRFVDFGNPGAKVAIECDGVAWHTDNAADEARQREIEARGWTVYRLSGAECKTDDKDDTDAETGAVRCMTGLAYRKLRRIADCHDIRLWSPARRSA